MGADLSEHFGRSGEFLIGLSGLILLLLMHPDIRRFARSKLRAFAAYCGRRHRALESGNGFYARWAAAFRMIFRERRDLLLIVAMLIGLEYFADLYNAAIQNHLIRPLYERGAYETASWDKIQQIASLHAFFLIAVITIGYALFGWLAYQRAQGADFRAASRFHPSKKLLGFAMMIGGLNMLADHLSPPPIMSLSIPDSWDWFIWYLVGAYALGGLLFLTGAALFKSPGDKKTRSIMLKAGGGYVTLSLAISWFYYALGTPIPRASGSWMTGLTFALADFSGAALRSIILVGFAVVLAAPALKDRNGDPSDDAARAV